MALRLEVKDARGMPNSKIARTGYDVRLIMSTDSSCYD